MPGADALLEKIQALPPDKLWQVEDFIVSLNARARRMAALDRLLAIAPALEAAGAPDISMAEIDAEVKAVRAERRAGCARADRS